MDDHSLTTEHSKPVLDIPEAKVYEYVMKESKIKLDCGHSVTDIEKHLKNAAALVGEQIPTMWSGVLKMLKKLGYTNPHHYKVCASHDHSFLLKSREEHPTCGICGKQWQDCIDYYCLGLNFMDWFATEERCQKLMAHWNAKEEWFNKPSEFKPPSMSELWHGERFRELSPFWDTTQEFLLPTRCPHCANIVSTDELENACVTDSGHDCVSVCCPHCLSRFVSSLQYTHGDPRNQAIIVHEDGVPIQCLQDTLLQPSQLLTPV